MIPFVAGLIVGVVLGAMVGFVYTAALMIASDTDERDGRL